MSDWLLSREEFDRVTSDGNAVVLFTAPAWCVPCQRFEPHWDRAKTVIDDEKLPIRFYRVDVDDNDWAMVDFGIRSVPTCQLWTRGSFERNVRVPQGALPFLTNIRSELGV